MNIREKLSAMIEFGMSQHEIKRDTGISQASISRILAGSQTNLKLSTVNAIDKFYKRVTRRKNREAADSGLA